MFSDGPISSQPVSAVYAAGATAVTLTLGSVNGTGALGTLVAVATFALSGANGTGSPGSFSKLLTVSPTAAVGTGSIGTLTLLAARSLTGVGGTGGVGTFTAGATGRFRIGRKSGQPRATLTESPE